jgi:hypothetical protein|tara:strand:- start:1371 stop:1574 length:204 start_codon:yes stop_codon:yes gene_type:complete
MSLATKRLREFNELSFGYTKKYLRAEVAHISKNGKSTMSTAELNEVPKIRSFLLEQRGITAFLIQEY